MKLINILYQIVSEKIQYKQIMYNHSLQDGLMRNVLHEETDLRKRQGIPSLVAGYLHRHGCVPHTGLPIAIYDELLDKTRLFCGTEQPIFGVHHSKRVLWNGKKRKGDND